MLNEKIEQYLSSRKEFRDEFEWFLTDDDSWQHCRKVGVAPLDNVFELVQVQSLPDGDFAIAHAVIDLNHYSNDELDDVCKMYFDMGLEDYEESDFFAGYGTVAEAIFETEALADLDFSFGTFHSFSEAVAAVDSYKKKHCIDADIDLALHFQNQVKEIS